MEEQLPFSTKPKIDKNAVPIILWNLFPFIGVIFAGWKPESVFICYALETIIVGIFNVFKLIAVYRYGLPQQEGESGVTGLGIIPFFIVHYYFFVFVQLSIFFSKTPFGLVNTIISFVGSNSIGIALTVFAINCGFSFINDFILTGKYTQRSMAQQMFEPYPRIFVQQFVVIIGGFIFSVTGNGYPVLVVFVVLKIYLDLILKDFDIGALSKMAKKKVDNSY